MTDAAREPKPQPSDLHPALVAPGHFYVTGEDFLQLSSFCTASGVTLTIVGRHLSIGGEVRPFSETHVANSNGTEKTTAIGIGEGWLLNLSVIVAAGTPGATECPVLVYVKRGAIPTGIEIACLVQGNVTSRQRVMWPGAPANMNVLAKAMSRIRMIVGTDPAAGVEISETVPTGKRWRLMTMRYTLATSATVANRDSDLIIDDGAGNIAFRGLNQTGQAAGLTYPYDWGTPTVRQTPAFRPVEVVSPFPAVTLGPGSRIQTSTFNLQAGDNYSAPVYLVEEFDE